MSRRIPLIAFAGTLLLLAAGCTNKKSVNPLSQVESKQPDKVLFDKAMDAMRHNRFDVARLTLQTLINAYPDSEFIARAKLAVGDSWYAEGGTTALAQAEQEYRDFQTFFPNMPEAAEAQLKIANIQYQQMDKPDRDFTHARRAEEEYRNLILQYPENTKLVAEGKQRLLEVQEVLAEREFEIGRFYYLRQSYPASTARLLTLVDKYPLYSKADEALYLLGQNYEGQIARLRSLPLCDAHYLPVGCVTEKNKAAYLDELTQKATEKYDKIITRYPLMDASEDAKKRLAALNQPIPHPTKAALAQNKAEEDSRRDISATAKLMGLLKKGPDVSQASQVGEPTLTETEPIGAIDVVSQTMRDAINPQQKNSMEKNLGVTVVSTGTPPPNEEAPRSDTPAQPSNGSPFARAGAATTADPNELKPASADSNELKPNAAADPNELKPNADNTSDAALPPPPQINEIHSADNANAVASADSSSSSLASDQDVSSSKKKKKKGLKKLVPF